MLIQHYHNNIDTMPIYNYLQVVDHGNYSALIRKRGLFKRNFTTAFENLQRQLVARFGIAEGYIELLEKKRELTLLNINLHVTGDKSYNSEIRIVEAELKDLTDRKSSTNDEIKDYLEKYKGFHLSLHQITVAEWFGYIKNYSKQQQQLNKSQ